MAVNSVVIRYLPYDVLETGGYLGVTRHDLIDNNLATAVYPGYEPYTDVTMIIDGPYYGNFSGLRYGDAGLTSSQREFEFVTLAVDGTTAEPIDESVDHLLVIYNGVYAGGTIEVGAYVDGEYMTLGAADMGIPYDFDSGWNYVGVKDIALTWPGGLGFWTQMKQAQEV